MNILYIASAALVAAAIIIPLVSVALVKHSDNKFAHQYGR